MGGGTYVAFSNPSWDGGEGGEQAVHMPTSFTNVTEEHFFFVKGALAYLALGILGGGAVTGVERGGVWVQEWLRLGAWGSEIGLSR